MDSGDESLRDKVRPLERFRIGIFSVVHQDFSISPVCPPALVVEPRQSKLSKLPAELAEVVTVEAAAAAMAAAAIAVVREVL